MARIKERRTFVQNVQLLKLKISLWSFSWLHSPADRRPHFFLFQVQLLSYLPFVPVTEIS